MKPISGLVLVGWIMGSVAGQQAPATPARIAGRVIEAGSGVPIAGVQVTLASPANPEVMATTDDQGRFSFDGLVAGSYRYRANANGYTGAATPGTLLRLDAGANIGNLVIELSRTAVIAGRVLDANHDPVPGARVILVRRQYSLGSSRPMLAPNGRNGTANDLGEYRIFPVDPGEYYIRVSTPIGGRSEDIAYPDTYFPNTTDASQAAPITVGAGEEYLTADISIAPGGVRVRGRIVYSGITPERPGIEAFLLMRRNATVLEQPMLTFNRLRRSGIVEREAGEFELGGVLPGSYYLYAQTRIGRSTGFARTELEVGDVDVEAVTLTFSPISAKGRVKIRSTSGAPPAMNEIAIGLLTAEPAPMPVGLRIRPSALAEDGTFTIDEAVEGHYYPIISNALPGWYISSVFVDGRDALHTGFSLRPGNETFVEIEVSSDGGTVSGTVRNASGNPVFAVVVLVPRPEFRHLPMLFYKVRRAPSSSQFEITAIRPGSYTMLAFPIETSSLEVMDSEWIEPYLSQGVQVDVSASQTLHKDIVLVTKR